MEALWSCYSSSSDDDEEEVSHRKKRPKPEETNTQNSTSEESKNAQSPTFSKPNPEEEEEQVTLPPPPDDLLCFSYQSALKPVNRPRTFPHKDGNYALHVYIPVALSALMTKTLSPLLTKATRTVPQLFAIETDQPLGGLQDNKDILPKQFHISLSRTVAIRVHQIDSMVSMLRRKLGCHQKRYVIEFGKWSVFNNDEMTRSFLAMEVISGGMAEISKQVLAVDEVFRMHNLPEFYRNPRPHISVAWGLGDITDKLGKSAQELNRACSELVKSKSIWSSMFGGIECKIGQSTYSICK